MKNTLLGLQSTKIAYLVRFLHPFALKFKHLPEFTAFIFYASDYSVTAVSAAWRPNSFNDQNTFFSDSASGDIIKVPQLASVGRLSL